MGNEDLKFVDESGLLSARSRADKGRRPWGEVSARAGFSSAMGGALGMGVVGTASARQEPRPTAIVPVGRRSCGAVTHLKGLARQEPRPTGSGPGGWESGQH